MRRKILSLYHSSSVFSLFAHVLRHTYRVERRSADRRDVVPLYVIVGNGQKFHPFGLASSSGPLGPVIIPKLGWAMAFSILPCVPDSFFLTSRRSTSIAARVRRGCGEACGILFHGRQCALARPGDRVRPGALFSF